MRTTMTGMSLAAGAAIVAVMLAGCGGGSPQQSTTDAAPAADVGADRFGITLNTGGPLKVSGAPLDVTVLEGGQPVTDAEVSVELRMPPSATMGEMRTGTELSAVGDGRYRGQVDASMAGQWNAIVRVKRAGEVVATHTEPVTVE